MIYGYYSVLDLYKGMLERQMQLYKDVMEPPKINVENTEYPVCPWCGAEQKQYENFMLKPRDILCCKEDIDKCYMVTRHMSNKLTYTTHKVPNPIPKRDYDTLHEKEIQCQIKSLYRIS